MEYIVGAAILYLIGKKFASQDKHNNKQTGKTRDAVIAGYIRDDEGLDAMRFNSDYIEEDIKRSGAILGDYEYAIGKADKDKVGSTTATTSSAQYFANYNYVDMPVQPAIQPGFHYTTVPYYG